MGEAGGTEQLPWRHPKARFFGAPPRFFAQEQRNGVEWAVGATNYRPRKRRTRTIPRQAPAPCKSRARNVPSTDWQRSRGWWSRRGKKSAFLWRLDTVSLGKHQRNGVESQDRPSTTSQRIGAHVESKDKAAPHLRCCVCAVLLGKSCRPLLPVPPHFFALAQRKGVEPQRNALLGAATGAVRSHPPLPRTRSPNVTADCVKLT